jgi:hypothetical protein
LVKFLPCQAAAPPPFQPTAVRVGGSSFPLEGRKVPYSIFENGCLVGEEPGAFQACGHVRLPTPPPAHTHRPSKLRGRAGHRTGSKRSKERRGEGGKRGLAAALKFTSQVQKRYQLDGDGLMLCNGHTHTLALLQHSHTSEL